MYYRGKHIKHSLVSTDTQRSDTRHIVAEPGDATKYELLVTSFDNATTSAVHERNNSIVVTVLNLTGEPKSMFLRPGKLHWLDIRNGLGICAEGSCYFITVLIAYICNGFICMDAEEFCASYEKWLANKNSV